MPIVTSRNIDLAAYHDLLQPTLSVCNSLRNLSRDIMDAIFNCRYEHVGKMGAARLVVSLRAAMNYCHRHEPNYARACGLLAHLERQGAPFIMTLKDHE